jgi:hypothetical protein
MNCKHVGVETLFSALVDKFAVDGIDNVRLADEVMKSQERLSEDPCSCLFEDTSFLPSEGGPGDQLINCIQELAHKAGMRLSEVWSQIHRPLESTGLHHHMGGDNVAAFVYYVSVPEKAGHLCFEFEHGHRHIIVPKEGDLYVFPAWAKHKVTKNLSSDVRISISGNLVAI